MMSHAGPAEPSRGSVGLYCGFHAHLAVLAVAERWRKKNDQGTAARETHGIAAVRRAA
jgi:hypothetical protein